MPIPKTLLLFAFTAASFAQTLTVTTTLDTVDLSDGLLSLREAILAANANVDASGQCRGINNIVFRLPATNAVATAGSITVPYYKIRINYPDPDYARAMNTDPIPTPLPHVRCPIHLDGYSQPGVRPGSPLIEISGEDLPLAFPSTPASLAGSDLQRTSELLTLSGRLARQLEEGQNQVGCRPADAGCPLRRSASSSTIRGLMFNRSPQTGLSLFGADDVTITGNYFGLDATGENPAPNGRRIEDVSLFSMLLNGSSNNIIGTPGERNYFGVARSHAIMMWPFTNGSECAASTPANATCSRWDIGSAENIVQSNYFGLNKTGTRSLGGICVHASPDRRFIGERDCAEGRTRSDAIYTSGGPLIYIFFHPNNIAVSRNSMKNNRIGGYNEGGGNVFAAGFSGVTLRAVDTEIAGNIFGLAADGISASTIGPFFRGGIIIASDSAGTSVIGNIITNSANFVNVNSPEPHGPGAGVTTAGTVTGPGYSDDLTASVIRDNYIGPNARQQHPGMNLIGMPATNAVGGIAALWMLPLRIENNVIAYNGFTGNAAITARNTVLNANTANEQVMPPRRLVVLDNSIFCNGIVAQGQTCGRGMGIDWSALMTNLPPPAVGDGPTLNDPDDSDDGPAELQNYPTLEATGTGVKGRFTGKPGVSYRIQLFAGANESFLCVPVTTTVQPGFQSSPECANSSGALAFLAAQGETLLGEIDVMTGPDGTIQFSASTPANRLITATATRLDPHGVPLATSEFSQAVKR